MKKKTKDQLERELKLLEKRAAEKRAAIRKVTATEQAKERADNYRTLESMAQRYGFTEKDTLELSDRLLLAATNFCRNHKLTYAKFIAMLNEKSGM